MLRVLLLFGCVCLISANHLVFFVLFLLQNSSLCDSQLGVGGVGGIVHRKGTTCNFLLFTEPEKCVVSLYYIPVGDILYQSKRQHLLLLLLKICPFNICQLQAVSKEVLFLKHYLDLSIFGLLFPYPRRSSNASFLVKSGLSHGESVFEALRHFPLMFTLSACM